MSRPRAVLGGLLNQQTAFGVYCDSLAFIVDVRMGGNFHAIGIEGFKDHDGGSRQGAGVQGIGQFHGASAFFRGELHLSSDFRIIHQQWLIRGLVHEYARNGVGLARGQASVPHHIHDGDFPCGISDVAAVHGSGGAQGGLLRLGDLHGLCFVVNIRNGASAFFRGELHLSGDFRAIHQERLASGFIHKDTGNGVGLAGGQTRVGNRIHNGHFPGGNCCVLAVHGGGGADFRFLHKVDGLALVLDVLMADDFRFSLEESFKNYYRFALQAGGVKGE